MVDSLVESIEYTLNVGPKYEKRVKLVIDSLGKLGLGDKKLIKLINNAINYSMRFIRTKPVAKSIVNYLKQAKTKYPQFSN